MITVLDFNKLRRRRQHTSGWMCTMVKSSVGINCSGITFSGRRCERSNAIAMAAASSSSTARTHFKWGSYDEVGGLRWGGCTSGVEGEAIGDVETSCSLAEVGVWCCNDTSSEECCSSSKQRDQVTETSVFSYEIFGLLIVSVKECFNSSVVGLAHK